MSKMAFSSGNCFLLAFVMICIFVCAFGQAYDYPHLGAAGVVANEYLPQAEAEGETDQYYPKEGIINTRPAVLFSKALECLEDKYIYSSCEEEHRLTQTGELHVPPEYTDEYCNGPCLHETKHVLECIEGILKHFEFYNKATLDDVHETIESGCSYGPKRGNFDVLEHIQADDSSKNKVSHTVVYGILVMIIGWRMLL
ncbi:hypothetical protein CDL12_08085 [Handroanthus impetiginosus]|uniref:DUF7731 domain-containing protein n=1 Tax=Handroanthus impetiginosus TaxID=429701 RepID=A0A2G9HNY4_9LAMI|nr:hypothetical protein CDL12_08085 [Handroanthus impetiginosus]